MLGGRRARSIFTHHEIYVIYRSEEVNERKFTYKKIMDCRYTPLTTVQA